MRSATSIARADKNICLNYARTTLSLQYARTKIEKAHGEWGGRAPWQRSIRCDLPATYSLRPISDLFAGVCVCVRSSDCLAGLGVNGSDCLAGSKPQRLPRWSGSKSSDCIVEGPMTAPRNGLRVSK